MPLVPDQPRVIGHYRGEESGPVVVVIGGIHGNEPAGVAALERLFDLLAEEPRINPGFSFSGELLALRGNLEALAAGRRYVDVDLNRIWHPTRRAADAPYPNVEARELNGLLAAIEHVLEENPHHELVLLDLHTTTAGGGIFSVTADDQPSLMLAAEMAVPVVKGMLNDIQGTTLGYFRGGHFGAGRRVRAITFEAGTHQDPRAIDCALAATVNLLRALGCVRSEDVSTHHDKMLQACASGLPLMTELAYVHRLADGRDDFKMLPGYQNFQLIKAGEVLATDAGGQIVAPCSGYLLMPLYQRLGREGFFIVRDYLLPSGF